MPYIVGDRRCPVMTELNPKTAGELNFLITRIIQRYLHQNFIRESYQGYNDVLGVLEGCKLELYRRKVAPYENDKCALNGDVYFEKGIS